MILYVLRHGIAEDHAPSGDDADRRLTDEGRRKLALILGRARQAGAAPEIIVSSPYVRARQTAEIAAERLGSSDTLSLSQTLYPYSDVRETWQEVRGWRELDSVMLVGHNPHLTDLVSTLVGGGGRGGVGMKKGALARLEIDPLSPEPRGWLEWLLTAKTAG